MQTEVNTPTGVIYLKAVNGAIAACGWRPVGASENSAENKAVLQLACTQLMEYFAGTRTQFQVPVAPEGGTPFQRQVWQKIKEIAFGRVQTYEDIAQALQSSPRAVGGATGKNPVPLFIPCHRVMGKSGKLTGFSGGEGIVTKKQLLQLEHVL